ncbi:MAG: universal stress protein [Anaerolineae bacterium]|nr:universal stress protein [Anaerolineae bacterium]
MTTIPARMYSRVLVPLDGSVAAEFAIRFALDLASKHSAEMILLYLNAMPLAAISEDDQQQSADETQQYLEKLRKDVREAGVPVRTQIIDSRDPGGALTAYADEELVSVVVMSTQGRQAMLRWLFGSHIEESLNRMMVPVMLVRPVYDQIVVPLDGSRWSESAISRATELARVHDAEIVLLHVYQQKGSDYADQWALAGHQQIADQQIDQIRDQLVSLRNRLRQEGLKAREVLIRGGNPAQVICEYAENEEDICMIVMSTHGRTGLSKWLVGSVAQSVIKKTRVPVTLVQPDRT